MSYNAMRAAVWLSPLLAECLPVNDAKPQAVQKIEVSVERKLPQGVERMEPNHVFETGELVRFRFRLQL